MRAHIISATGPSPEHPYCVECGLYKGKKHPFQGMVGNTDPSILAVAEAP